MVCLPSPQYPRTSRQHDEKKKYHSSIMIVSVVALVDLVVEPVVGSSPSREGQNEDISYSNL